MKTLVIAGAITVALFGVVTLVIPAKSQSQPIRMSQLDQEKLRRINADLSNLETQYRQAIQPELVERGELFERNCTAAKLTLKHCPIDPKTFVVSRGIPAPGGPTGETGPKK